MSPLEALRHPHMQARAVYNEQGGVLQAAPAPRFGGAAYETNAMCAAGAHTAEVLAAVQNGNASQAWRSA